MEYMFVVQCPVTNIIYNIWRSNYASANILEKQLKHASVNYQLLT